MDKIIKERSFDSKDIIAKIESLEIRLKSLELRLRYLENIKPGLPATDVRALSIINQFRMGFKNSE